MMKKLWLLLKRIRELIINQIHSILFLGGLYCLVRMVYFFSPVLGLGALGIALLLLALLVNQAKGGDK
ncbi:hypothetical protein ACSFB8_07445 [Enterococcus faecalis]